MVASASSTLRFAPGSLAVVVAFAWLPCIGHAADAHRAVQVQAGDVVLLRNVPTRPADRPAPPGMALIVSPSPRPEISAALGARELSDDDYASLGATPTSGVRPPSTTVGRALEGSLVRGTAGSDGAVASNGVSNTVSVPVAAVGNATRGIANQVQGALAQLPLGNGH